MLDYEQIKRDDIRELSSNAVLVIPIVRREEDSMIFAHFPALAVHNFEQILANVSNAPDLNERGIDPSYGGVRFTSRISPWITWMNSLLGSLSVRGAAN